MSEKNSKQTTANTSQDKTPHANAPYARKPIVWAFSFILLIIIVVAFVVAPIYTPIAADSQKIVFGTYDGQEIAYKSGNFFASQYDAAKQNSTTQGDNTQAEYSALRMAFDQTVFHTAVLNEAARIGFSASDKKIDAMLADNPRFQENGSFSNEKFKKISQIEVTNMKKLTQDQIIQQRIVSDLSSEIKESPKEVAFIKDMARWSRSFDVVTFTSSDYPDAEVRVYGQKNLKLFRTIDLASLTVPNKADAETFRQQIIDKTASLEDLAKAHSTDTYKDRAGQRGIVPYHDVQLQLSEKTAADIVFALKAGELSPVLAVSGGYAIYRANDAARDPNLQESGVITTIRSYIVANERGTVDDYLSAQANTFSTKARVAGLDSTAKAFGKTVKTTDRFPINHSGLEYPSQYGNFPILPVPTLDKQPLSNAVDKENFFETAFKLKKDEISDPILLQDQIVILKLKEDKQLEDKDIGLLNSATPMLLSYFTSSDLKDAFVQKNKLVDNFDKIFVAHFVNK